LEEESSPDRSHYVWAYHITIENERHEEVQLLKRYWKITDGQGRTKEICGEGVLGKQPILDSQELFEYTSGVPLPTPTGFMGGLYFFRTASGQDIEVVIPTFSLDSPYESLSIN
jgi:ApaG protein